MKNHQPSDWSITSEFEDFLGTPFQTRKIIPNAAYPSEVCHLIRYPKNTATKAILYVHGYTDYFFQTDFAATISQLNYHFYAIDLKGYGRSIQSSGPPNSCDRIKDYFYDLYAALSVMKKDNIQEVVLLGHSTGGLITSYFLDWLESNPKKELPKITGHILNSPFLTLPFPPHRLNWMTRLIKGLTTCFPFYRTHSYKDKLYAKTIHQRFEGEWNYRLDWKPSHGFYMSYRWLKEILAAQEVLSSCRIHTPTLLCRSSKSTYNAKEVRSMRVGDGVLDVESMQEAANKIFSCLATDVIENGFHDLALSSEPARQAYQQAIKDWLFTLDNLSKRPH